jgi:hypothetical protein
VRRLAGARALLALAISACELPSPGVGDALPEATSVAAPPTAAAAAPQEASSEGALEKAAGPASASSDPSPPTPPEPIPRALLAELSPTPYVEERCEPDSSSPRARRCRYTTLGVTAEVVVENPTAEEAARWFLDAARSCEPLEAFRETEPATWVRGVLAFAKHTRRQSSRIFPLRGEVVEDLGDGPHAFGFDRGVVAPCEKGTCRCRINSLTSAALCRYREVLGGDLARCLEALSSDEAWRTQCVENHRNALATGVNEHLHARAHLAGREIRAKCDAWERARKRPCSPGEVVMMLEQALGLVK